MVDIVGRTRRAFVAFGGDPSGTHPLASLLAAIDDPYRHAAAFLDFGGEGAPVAGFAHRGGSDDREMIDGERPRQGDEALQIGKGELDAVGIEPAGHRDAAPERAHHLFV